MGKVDISSISLVRYIDILVDRVQQTIFLFPLICPYDIKNVAYADV